MEGIETRAAQRAGAVDDCDDPLELIGQVPLPLLPFWRSFGRSLDTRDIVCLILHSTFVLFWNQAVLARFGPARMDATDAATLSALEAQKTFEHSQAATRRQVRTESLQR